METVRSVIHPTNEMFGKNLLKKIPVYLKADLAYMWPHCLYRKKKDSWPINFLFGNHIFISLANIRIFIFIMTFLARKQKQNKKNTNS